MRWVQHDPMHWRDFERATPDLAALGMRGFSGERMCVLGTIAADGWPRISPCEIYFPDGHLLLGMMRNSRKSNDLERDDRITVATPQAQRDPELGDFKIFGRAGEVTDPALRELYGRTVFEAIAWRPAEPYPLWEVDIERAVYIEFGDHRRLLRWSPASGTQELLHPDDDPNAGAPMA